MESVGNLEPDAIIQQGIAVMQTKLAGLIHHLSDGDASGDYAGPRSPEYNGGDGWGQDQGFTTPYENGGYGGAGGTTPFGTTPFGQPGQSGY